MKNWFRRILAKFPCQNIGDGRGSVFFYRYTLLKTRWLGVYLHEFLRGDVDRCLHDHPWPFVTIILRAGYWEEMPDGRHWRKAGSILYRPAKTAHRIETEPGTFPLSLVFVGPKSRAWGFYTINGWRPWKKGEPNPLCEVD